MFSNLKLILGTAATLAVFGLGAYVGHYFGARKVAGLQAQIESFKAAGSAADEKLKESQAEIAKTLEAKEAEYAKQAQQLKSEADQREKDLAAALHGRDARIKALQNQVASIHAERAKLEAQLQTASAADKAAIQSQLDALAQKEKPLTAKMLGNECLAAVVPEEVVQTLAWRDVRGLKLSLALGVPEEGIRPLSARN